MTREDYTSIATHYGWEPIDSNNPHMISFLGKDDERMNVYFTTGTVTIQYKVGKKPLSLKDANAEAFENFLINDPLLLL